MLRSARARLPAQYIRNGLLSLPSPLLLLFFKENPGISRLLLTIVVHGEQMLGLSTEQCYAYTGLE